MFYHDRIHGVIELCSGIKFGAQGAACASRYENENLIKRWWETIAVLSGSTYYIVYMYSIPS